MLLRVGWFAGCGELNNLSDFFDGDCCTVGFGETLISYLETAVYVLAFSIFSFF